MTHFKIKESEYYKEFRMFLTDDMCVGISLNKLRRWFKDACNP